MLKKAGYILITTLLIVSTMGVVISKHYCKQTLVSIAVNAQADRCSNGMNDNGMNDDGMNADCCHDVNEYVILKTNFVKPSFGQFNIVVIDIFNAELISILNEVFTENTNNNAFATNPKPPEKIKSLAVIQSFLL